jgi:3-hydroxyacyl-[acyl-carrier-protein] dehydratase
MRFSLVGRITSLEAGRSVTAVKNLSLAEEYLADHFPGFPVMPGVLMLESLVQASAWLMRYTEDFRYSTILLKEARAVRFNNFVSPGRTLVVTSSFHERTEHTAVLKGVGTVDGLSAVNARLTLEQYNASERGRPDDEADRYCIQKMRELFAQIWRPEGTVAEN